MSDELTPITRKETFLAKAGGQNVVTPTPITREETFLQAIINSGSGGGTGGGVLIVNNVNGTLDKNWAEIYEAKLAIFPWTIGNKTVLFSTMSFGEYEGLYEINFYCPSNDAPVSTIYASSTTRDGYPVIDMG